MNCSALIVTYNRLEKLKLTIANTVKLNFTAIVVVNNGSTDGTCARLATLSDPRVIVLNLPSNSGGAGGFKAGSQYLCDNVDSDWVFFYDDDAAESDALEKFAQLEKANCRVFTALVKDLQGQPCPMNMPLPKFRRRLWTHYATSEILRSFFRRFPGRVRYRRFPLSV